MNSFFFGVALAKGYCNDLSVFMVNSVFEFDMIISIILPHPHLFLIDFIFPQNQTHTSQ